MSDYDDYGYDDDDYDDAEFDDAADDWEEEAIQIEEQEKAEKLARELLLERRTASRAAKKAVAEEKVEEQTTTADVQREIDILRQEASNVASTAELSSTTVDLIADMPATSTEEAVAIGKAIAAQIVQQGSASSCEKMLTELLKSIAKEYTKPSGMVSTLTTANVTLEKAKRQEKLRKRRGELEPKKSAAAMVNTEMPDEDDETRDDDIMDDAEQQW